MIPHVVKLEVIECPECAVPFAVPEALVIAAKTDDNAIIICPSGHEMEYSNLVEGFAMVDDDDDDDDDKDHYNNRHKVIDIVVVINIFVVLGIMVATFLIVTLMLVLLQRPSPAEREFQKRQSEFFYNKIAQ